ncbi:DUF488 domain-containing protein [Bradyrhizobium sp.]|uniref:DUF488 domain-containing protein n=1 Tax=Bradyrhizobium sp. TaxID=376 RepID=UPI001EB5C205|nr:DUF488 domain-containing protein [Bradyrhizobium sp.]MBV8919565.1 DUF488 domain-containing protein [Bradyrhizobium sp.]MBV9979580.1 DUF488 domain-containing protein [Bradyrhizobium sp.]
MAHPFYTIGHGTRSLTDLVQLLRSVEVTLLVDVRTVPRSRTNPQYNRDSLPDSLAPFAIGYEHIAALGGLRGRLREVAQDVNAFWENESFHNYADYAMGATFRDGLSHLRALGRERRSAVMCAETVWWRCHRRIITDYLLAAGESVFHILGPGHVEPAAMTETARAQRDGTLIYPAAQPDLFDRTSDP